MFFDYYIPPETNNVPAIEASIVKNKTELISASQEINQTINPLKDKPTEDDFKGYAESIKEIFSDGFDWSDISDIMKLALRFVSSNFTITGTEKKAAVIKIIDYLIDKTDVPYLPDFFLDPIFKAIANRFVDIVIPDTIETIIPPQKITGSFNETLVDNFINELKNDFADGFQWHDIGDVTSQSIKFVHQFVDASLDEKKQTAKDIVDKIIDNTNIPLIPDEFADPILKSIANGFIDNIIDAVDALAII